MTVNINPKQLLTRVFIITVGIYMLSLVHRIVELSTGQSYGLFFFDVDYARNIPAVFYVVLTAIGALLAYFVARTAKHTKMQQLAWLGVAFVALMMAIDKGTSLSTTFSRAQLTALFHLNDWSVLPIYGLIGLVGAGVAWWLARKLPPQTFRLLLAWLGVKAFGMIVLYLVSGYYAHWVTLEDFLYTFLSTLEEFVETVSTLILIYAILDYFSSFMSTINLRIEQPSPQPKSKPIATQPNR